jgi:Chitobiase/beta-hexosaminidase C-terminal domain
MRPGTEADRAAGECRGQNTIDGTDPTVSGTALTYSAPFTLASTATVRFHATDAAGNASAAGSQAVVQEQRPTARRASAPPPSPSALQKQGPATRR